VRYPYECPTCHHDTDIIKSVDDIENVELCPICDTIMDRLIVGGSCFMGEKIEEAEYNPGLGCIVNNKKHRDEIAKRKGLIEIGNEDPQKIQSGYDKAREKKLASTYDGIHEFWQKDNRIEIKGEK